MNTNKTSYFSGRMKEKENSKDIMIQISDYISELEILIDNVNVLSEELHTNLINQIDSETLRKKCIIRHDLKVSAVKSGMIREFVLWSSEIINNLTKLT